MNFNGFVFPCPKFDFRKFRLNQNQLIFIPKKTESISKKHIPCLFLHPESLNKTKNFMIVFHGNAEDIYSAKVFAEALYKKTLMNVVMVEYPGYSIYKGGRSIGTSPAIYLSSRRKPNALCVVSSFTSIRAVANNLVGPLKYLLKERFNSKEYIKNVTCPILFVHGQSDPLIPYKETLLLE